MNKNNLSQSLPKPATLGSILLAILYDSIIVIAFLLIASALWLPSGIVLGHPWFPLYKAFLFLSVFLYFVWCWCRGGQTVGMKAWRIRLVRDDGTPVHWPQATARFAYALLSWGLLGLGYWSVLWHKENKTWHDRLSSTQLWCVAD